jgi:restriction system protein
MDKHAELLALARKRQAMHWDGYNGIGVYQGGIYECDFVSPYTKTAGNVDSEVMVILQDWSSHDRLNGPVDQDSVDYGLTRNLPTNVNLIRLLHNHFGVRLTDIYATNLFPFIKAGSTSRYIPPRDLQRAAREFALPQIKIVKPKLVICLGFDTFNALQKACELGKAKDMEEAITSPFEFEDIQIWCQAHTGTFGQNNRNQDGVDRVTEDWTRMRRSVGY